MAMDYRTVEVAAKFADGNEGKQGSKMTQSVRELKLMERLQIRAEMPAKVTTGTRQRTH
jgi:hypothetical protein